MRNEKAWAFLTCLNILSQMFRVCLAVMYSRQRLTWWFACCSGPVLGKVCYAKYDSSQITVKSNITCSFCNSNNLLFFFKKVTYFLFNVVYFIACFLIHNRTRGLYSSVCLYAPASQSAGS